MKRVKFPDGRLMYGDCRQHMAAIPTGKIDLVFADPPFNIRYSYDEYKDDKSYLEYVDWTNNWVWWVSKLLKPRGSMVVAIGDEYAAEVKIALDRCLYFRNWIVWKYSFGVYCQKKFGRDHTHLLYYTKDRKKFTFNADAIRVPSDRLLKYEDKRADPRGRVPGDVWEFPRVCGTFKERNEAGHKCQMPEALLERVVKALSDEGDLVYDPFAGTGTTLAVARKLGRRWLGSELSANYCAGIRRRLRTIPVILESKP